MDRQVQPSKFGPNLLLAEIIDITRSASIKHLIYLFTTTGSLCMYDSFYISVSLIYWMLPKDYIIHHQSNTFH